MIERKPTAPGIPLQRSCEDFAAIHGGRQAATARCQISVKLQLDLPVGSRIGPGKAQLLELIETEGSLSRAAHAMGISYRRAWLFGQQINAAFEQPAIATPEHGHGGAAARLTEFGKELIRRYRRLESITKDQGEEELSWFASHQRQK